MTLSIHEREVQLTERENRILEIEQTLCRQQQMLVKLVQKIYAYQNVKHRNTPTIDNVLEHFMTKIGRDTEESRRKYRTICRYINAIGLTGREKYSRLHNAQSMVQIVQSITDRTDILGNQKMRHVRWVTALAKFATLAYPDLYKTDVLTSLPSVKHTPKSARRPHTPYSDEQLQRIFNPKWRFFREYPDLFWGCMIALFTGSRKNAVFTLQYKDIIQQDGIWCINFIEDCPGIKKLKTEDSSRIVPMHSTLVKMGFLDYLRRKPHGAQTDFIFQNICITSHGTLDSHMTRKLFYFLEQIGVRNSDGGRYDFHSFRKNANIAMEKCGILRPYIDKIIGWQSRGSEGERSYSNYTIKQIAEQLELLNYDCLRTEFTQWKKIMQTNFNVGVY